MVSKHKSPSFDEYYGNINDLKSKIIDALCALNRMVAKMKKTRSFATDSDFCKGTILSSIDCNTELLKCSLEIYYNAIVSAQNDASYIHETRRTKKIFEQIRSYK